MPWSYEFIKKYEDKWKWAARNYEFQITKSLPCSLSTNEGISWTLKILDEWEDRLDFWGIARFGKISSNEVLKYAERFYREETVGAQFLRYSDWRDTRYFFCTGWDNLRINRSFKIDLQLIDYAYNRNIPQKYYTGDNARDLCLCIIDRNLLDLLLEVSVMNNRPNSKDSNVDSYSKFENITIDDIINNEFEWSRFFISSEYIHDWVWKSLVKPLFSPNIICSFIDELQLINKH